MPAYPSPAIVDHAAPNLLKGALAGLVAGLVASAAMDGFQALVAALAPSGGGDEEPSTEKVADAVAKQVTGAPVPDQSMGQAGQLVHYLTGAGLGLAYGIAAEYRPEVTAAYGTAFAGTTATVLDEGVVPALGLGAPPWAAPASAHAYSYASHLVFGVAAEMTRSLLRRM